MANLRRLAVVAGAILFASGASVPSVRGQIFEQDLFGTAARGVAAPSGSTGVTQSVRGDETRCNGNSPAQCVVPIPQPPPIRGPQPILPGEGCKPVPGYACPG
jgi:hypothetical protein